MPATALLFVFADRLLLQPRARGAQARAVERARPDGARHEGARRFAPLALLLALALAGCGAKKDVLSAPSAKALTVMLDWFPNADHAPLYAAIAHGDFRAVGLDVKPVVPGGNGRTAEAARGRQGGHGDLLRAAAAAGAR